MVERIYVADIQQMPLVKVGTRMIRPQIERIYKSRVGAVGGIIQRVAIGIRHSESERPCHSAKRGLKCVITRVRHILQRKDSPEAGSKLAQGIRIGRRLRAWNVGLHQAITGGLQINERRLRRSDGSVVQQEKAAAVERTAIAEAYVKGSDQGLV